MVFRYEIPPNPGPLLQGEFLADLWEHRPLHPPVELPEDSSVPVDSIHHPLMVVMTAVCDLEQDFKIRFVDDDAQREYRPGQVDENDIHLVPHILLCELFRENEIRARIPKGSEVWKRISQNQDERYHHLHAGDIGNPAVDALPDLYLDFKRTIALPTAHLYEGVRSGQVLRIAVVPAVFVHDLIHRFFGFLSRVGLPES